MNLDLTAPIFHDTNEARAWLEAKRWPGGPACPHCGVVNVVRMQGKAHRPGLFGCRDCAGQFTVLTGSVMESSHIPLPKWVLAIQLMNSSKKGVSAHQLHRMLGITYKSAWFMAHRIREAMRENDPKPLGGEGKALEVDEMYHGKRETDREPQRHDKYRQPPTKQGKGGGAEKRPIVALVERGGQARAAHMTTVNGKNIREFLAKHGDTSSKLHTDESNLYPAAGRKFAKHETVNHSAKEYARGKGDTLVTTNSVEGFFGIFERGMVGVYQHCSEKHLPRYLDEFTFRYNNRSKLGVEDTERAERTVKAMNGKRLTYRRVGGDKAAAASTEAG
jgi:transposase-like protein